MKTNSCSLRQLLMSLCGELDLDQHRRLQSAIQLDSLAGSRWRQLLMVAQDIKSGQSIESGEVPIATRQNAEELGPGDQDQSVQRIAAFFDGTFSERDAAEFELECWASLKLLTEVILLYQNHCRQLLSSERLTSEPAEAPPGLRERLIAMFPANEASIESSSVSILQTQPPAAGLAAVPEVVTIAQPSVVKQSHRKFWLNQPLGVAISTAAMFAVIVVSYQVVNQYLFTTPRPDLVSSGRLSIDHQSAELPNKAENPQPVDSGFTSSNGQRIANGNLPSESLRDDRPDSVPKSDLPGPRQELNSRQGLANSLAVPNDGTTFEPDRTTNSLQAADRVATNSITGSEDRNVPDKEEVDKSSSEVVQPAAVPTNLKWNWKEVEGLVAVRATGSTIWSGALTETDLENREKNARPLLAMECKVLPLSWAQLDFNELGNWTMSENTSFMVEPGELSRLESNSDSRLTTDTTSNRTYESDSSDARDAKVLINLQSGRIAISSAEPDSVIWVNSMTGRWSIRIATADTQLVVEQLDGLSVHVVAGSAIINGEELKARQKLSQPVNGRLERSTNNKLVRWLNKPEKRFPHKKLSELWLHSNNLFAELGQPDKILSTDRPLFRSGLATIDPPSLAKIYLGNELPAVRAEGILWLLEYGRDEVQLRKLALEMATQLATPNLELLLPQLVLAIQQRRLPPQSDSELLVQGLNHRNPAVRRLNYGLLLHLFGSLVDYDPEAETAIRNRQSQLWWAAVSRLYRRLGNAR